MRTLIVSFLLLSVGIFCQEIDYSYLSSGSDSSSGENKEESVSMHYATTDLHAIVGYGEKLLDQFELSKRAERRGQVFDELGIDTLDTVFFARRKDAVAVGSRKSRSVVVFTKNGPEVLTYQDKNPCRIFVNKKSVFKLLPSVSVLYTTGEAVQFDYSSDDWQPRPIATFDEMPEDPQNFHVYNEAAYLCTKERFSYIDSSGRRFDYSTQAGRSHSGKIYKVIDCSKNGICAFVTKGCSLFTLKKAGIWKKLSKFKWNCAPVVEKGQLDELPDFLGCRRIGWIVARDKYDKKINYHKIKEFELASEDVQEQ